MSVYVMQRDHIRSLKIMHILHSFTDKSKVSALNTEASSSPSLYMRDHLLREERKAGKAGHSKQERSHVQVTSFISCTTVAASLHPGVQIQWAAPLQKAQHAHIQDLLKQYQCLELILPSGNNCINLFLHRCSQYKPSIIQGQPILINANDLSCLLDHT